MTKPAVTFTPGPIDPKAATGTPPGRLYDLNAFFAASGITLNSSLEEVATAAAEAINNSQAAEPGFSTDPGFRSPCTFNGIHHELIVANIAMVTAQAMLDNEDTSRVIEDDINLLSPAGQEFFKNNGYENYLKLVGIMALFHDSGRPSDGPDKWDPSSDQNISKNLPYFLAGLPAADIAIVKGFIDNGGKTGKPKTRPGLMFAYPVEAADGLHTGHAFKTAYDPKLCPLYYTFPSIQTTFNYLVSDVRNFVPKPDSIGHYLAWRETTGGGKSVVRTDFAAAIKTEFEVVKAATTGSGYSTVMPRLLKKLDKSAIPTTLTSAQAATAYSDHEILAVDTALDKRDGFTKDKYGFLRKNDASDGNKVKRHRDKAGNFVMVMPPANAEDVHVQLTQTLKHINDSGLFKGTTAQSIKVLFGYKLEGFHWNAGSIIISKAADGKFTITAKTYDSFGDNPISQKALQVPMQIEMQSLFESNGFKGANFNLGERVEHLAEVQTGNDCGLYAERVIHNLKTESDDSHVHDGVLNNPGTSTDPAQAAHKKTGIALRTEDHGVVVKYTPHAAATFCNIPVALDTTKEAAIKKKTRLNDFVKELDNLAQATVEAVILSLDGHIGDVLTIPITDNAAKLMDLRLKLGPNKGLFFNLPADTQKADKFEIDEIDKISEYLTFALQKKKAAAAKALASSSPTPSSSPALASSPTLASSPALASSPTLASSPAPSGGVPAPSQIPTPTSSFPPLTPKPNLQQPNWRNASGSTITFKAPETVAPNTATKVRAWEAVTSATLFIPGPVDKSIFRNHNFRVDSEIYSAPLPGEAPGLTKEQRVLETMCYAFILAAHEKNVSFKMAMEIGEEVFKEGGGGHKAVNFDEKGKVLESESKNPYDSYREREASEIKNPNTPGLSSKFQKQCASCGIFLGDRNAGLRLAMAWPLIKDNIKKFEDRFPRIDDEKGDQERNMEGHEEALTHNSEVRSRYEALKRRVAIIK